MPAAETRTRVAGRRRKRGVTNWLHAADWRCEANRSSKVSNARDQRRCDISRSCAMPQRLFTYEDDEDRRLSIRVSRAVGSANLRGLADGASRMNAAPHLRGASVFQDNS